MTIARSCVKACVIVCFWRWQWTYVVTAIEYTCSENSAVLWIIQQNINQLSAEHRQHYCVLRSVSLTFLTQHIRVCRCSSLFHDYHSVITSQCTSWGDKNKKYKKWKVRKRQGGGGSRRQQLYFIYSRRYLLSRGTEQAGSSDKVSCLSGR
jgi:hypothetical protein